MFEQLSTLFASISLLPHRDLVCGSRWENGPDALRLYRIYFCSKIARIISIAPQQIPAIPPHSVDPISSFTKFIVLFNCFSFVLKCSGILGHALCIDMLFWLVNKKFVHIYWLMCVSWPPLVECAYIVWYFEIISKFVCNINSEWKVKTDSSNEWCG